MLEAIFVLSGVGLLMGILLAIGKKLFTVEVNPVFDRLMEILPGANCGGCGFPGCSGYANALAEGTATPDACPPGGPALIQDIGSVLGVEVTTREREVALVRCAGGSGQATDRSHYIGIDECRAAHAVAGGSKSCIHGCLGMGSCIDACPFEAIVRTSNGLVRVLPESCTGCRKCVDICPRHLISMVPGNESVHVLCINPDKARDVKAVCEVGCTGCRLCAKQSPRLTIEGALASVSTETRDSIPPAVALSCPQGAIYDARVYSLHKWLEDPKTRTDFNSRSAEWKAADKAARKRSKTTAEEAATTGSKEARASSGETVSRSTDTDKIQ